MPESPGRVLRGGCCCGMVRYEFAIDSVSSETLCHCETCRRVSAAPFVAWITVPRASLHISAEPARFQSSEHGTRSFCGRCATPLTFASSRYPDEIDVTTCSLDDPNALPPKDHTFTRSKLSWVHLADGLPEFETTGPE